MGKSSKLIKNFILGAKALSKDRSASNHEDKEQSNKAKSRWSLGKPYTCGNDPTDDSDQESDTRDSVDVVCEHGVACAVNADVKPEIAIPEPIEENAVSVCLSDTTMEELAVEQSIPMDGTGISLEDHAAVAIQAAFRGFLCRRAFGGLKDKMRVEAVVDDDMASQQTAMSSRCMQALVKVQARVRARQVRMCEEGQAVQRHIRERRQLRAQNGKSEEDWDHSTATLDELQAKMQNKQDAAIRRERALAYAFSQQLRVCASKRNRTAVDPPDQQFGWSWLERWMAARPPDNAGLEDDLLNAHQDGIKIDKSAIHGKFPKKKTDLMNMNMNMQPVAFRGFEDHHKGDRKFLIRDENEDNENAESCGSNAIWSSLDLPISKYDIAKFKDASKLRIPNYMTTTQSSKAKIHQS